MFLTVLFFVITHFDLDFSFWLLLVARFFYFPYYGPGSNIVLVRFQELPKSSSLIRSYLYNNYNYFSLEFLAGPRHADRHGEISYITPLRGFVHFLLVYGPWS